MVIEEKDFKLTPVSDSSINFDLELLYKVQPREKEARMEFKNVAYGISLGHAVRRIAQYRVTQKHKNEAITLLTYFKEFKEELDSLKALCEI